MVCATQLCSNGVDPYWYRSCLDHDNFNPRACIFFLRMHLGPTLGLHLQKRSTARLWLQHEAQAAEGCAGKDGAAKGMTCLELSGDGLTAWTWAQHMLPICSIPINK